MTSTRASFINTTLYVNDKRIDCTIPTKPIRDIAIEPSISKDEAIERAIEELKMMTSPLEITTNDWRYHYFHNENLTQSFPLDTYDTDQLSKEEIELMLNYKFLLGKFEDTKPKLFANQDGSYSLRQVYADGESCEEVGKRNTIINYSCGIKDEIVGVQEYSVCKYLLRIQTDKLCSIPYFQPLEKQDRTPIFCHLEGLEKDNLLFGKEYCMGRDNCAWDPIVI